jgi:hypothetical protein
LLVRIERPNPAMDDGGGNSMSGPRNVLVLRSAAIFVGLGVALIVHAQEVMPDEVAAQSPEILYGGAIGALFLLIVGFAVMVGTDRASRRRCATADHRRAWADPDC